MAILSVAPKLYMILYFIFSFNAFEFFIQNEHFA